MSHLDRFWNGFDTDTCAVHPIEVLQVGPWFQQVTWPWGETTGTWNTTGMLDALMAGVALKGKLALDIGCMAGVASRYMERLGAEVWPCDVEARWETQFDLVRRCFGMEAHYHDMSVYDLPPQLQADVVLMTGVYYHLEHPLLGLAKAWAATQGVLLIEGEIAPGFEKVAAFYLQEYEGDGSNWWVPTLPCLLDWLHWLPGEKRIVGVTPDGYLPNRVLLQVWRGA